MKNFNTIQEATKAAEHYFFEQFDYVGDFDYKMNRGIIEFQSTENKYNLYKFQCTIFTSEPLKRPVGRPKGPEKVYIGFKIEPKYHAEVKAMVKEYIRKKTTLLK
jgi:hypothetical protein